MTLFRNLVCISSWVLAAGVAAPCLSAEPAVTGDGVLFFGDVSGQPQITVNGRASTVRRAESYPMRQGSLVTGAGENASLVLSNGYGFHLGSGSNLEIEIFEHALPGEDENGIPAEDYTLATQFIATLHAGQLGFSIGELTGACVVIVRTPFADVWLTGGDGAIEVFSESAVLHVVSHPMEIDANSNSFTLAAGSRAVLTADVQLGISAPHIEAFALSDTPQVEDLVVRARRFRNMAFFHETAPQAMIPLLPTPVSLPASPSRIPSAGRE